MEFNTPEEESIDENSPIINFEMLNNNNTLLKNVQEEMITVAKNTIPSDYYYDNNNNLNIATDDHSIGNNNLKWKRKFY